MFCENCGNKLEDNVKVCPVCGTEVEFEDDIEEVAESAATTETAAPQPAVAPQPEMPNYGGNKTNKGGLPKKLLAGIGIAVAAVVVVAAGVAFGGPAIMRTLAPEKAYRNAEKQYLEKMVEDLMVSYDNGIDKMLNYDNTGAEIEATLTFGETLAELIDDYAKIELGEKTEVGLKLGYATKDNKYLLNGALLWGSKTLLAPEIVMDMEEEELYATVPELSKTTMLFDMGDLNMDDFSEMTVESQEVFERLSKAYPKSKTLQNMMSSYIKVALDAVEDDMIKHAKKDLKVGKVKQSCTAYTITMDGEELAQVGIAFLEAMKDDERIEELLVEFLDALDEKELDADDVYDELIEGIEYAIEDLESFDDDVEFEMVVYVGSDGDIYGREISIEGTDTYVHEYYDWYSDSYVEETEVNEFSGFFNILAPERGGKWALEVEFGEDDETYFEVAGEGELSGDKRSGTLEITIDEEDSVEFKLENVCVENLLRGELSGSIIYEVGGLLEEIIDEYGDYGYYYASASLPGILLLLEENVDADMETAAIQIDLDGNLDKFSAKLSLILEEKEFIGLAASVTTTSGDSIKIPSKAMEISDEDDLMDWVEEIAFDEVLEELEKKGLPEDIVDMLDGVIELYLD